MEIGISSQQLFEIGLNIAGFISVGALLMLIRSFFTKRKEKLVSVGCQNVPSIATETEMPKKRQESDINPTGEFIDLKGVNWNPQKDSVSIKPIENPGPPSRRKIINLAQNMLSNARNMQDRSQSDSDQQPKAGTADVIRKGAGR
jgi:hypothetical protein